MVKIGITTYERNDKNRFYIMANYVDGVRNAGGVPFLLPPGEKQLAVWLEIMDGFIISGGGDINPEHYQGEHHPDNYNLNSERDQTELQLAKLLAEHKVPTFAICRGMQVMNVALGGDLIVDIPDSFGTEVAHRQPPRDPIMHDIHIVADSRLASIVPQHKFSAASWHHQAINKLAPSLRPAAYAPDNVIEAMEFADDPWLLAVQWHAELTVADCPIQQKLCEYFIEYVKTEAQ